jgi:hypothetical protein
MKIVFSAILLSFAALGQPTVSNVRQNYYPAPNGAAPHSYMGLKWNISSEACYNRIQFGLTTSYGESEQVGTIGNPFCFSNPNIGLPILNDIGFPLSGLKSGSTYHFCVQSSFDGSTWSSCVDSTFATAGLPAIHPALPQISGLVIPTTPSASAQPNQYVMNADCTAEVTSGKTFLQVILAAVNGQPSGGAAITWPAESNETSPCNGIGFYFPNDTQAFTIPQNSSNMNLATGTFTVSNSPPGWTLTNGQAVMFANNIGPLPCSTTQGNDSNSYAPGTEPETQGPWLPNTVYYIVNANPGAGTFQTATIAGGSPITCTTSTDYASGGTLYMGQYPPIQHNPIIFTTATPDSTYAPPGVRAAPDKFGDPNPWQSKMAKLQMPNPPGSNPYTFNGSNFGLFNHDIHLRGIEVTDTPCASAPAPNCTQTLDPAPQNQFGGLITAPESFGLYNIVFDRSYVHCNSFPNRCNYLFSQFGGGNMAIINSEIDNSNYWIPIASPAPWNGNIAGTQGWTGTLSGSTLTIIPGSAQMGGLPSISCTSTANVTFTVTGGSVTGTAYVWVGPTCVPTMVLPTGQSGSCTGSMVDGSSVSHGCVVTTAASPGYNMDTAGGYNCYTLGTFTLTSGSPSSWVQGLASLTNYLGALDPGQATQCCVTMLGYGVGPGPYTFANDYFEGTGIHLFAEDGTISDPVSVWVKQNTFFWDQAKKFGSPTSNGYYYGNRNGPEWKHGRQVKIDGNIFSGCWADISLTGPCVLLHVASITQAAGGCTISAGSCVLSSLQPGYAIQDFDVTNNFFSNVSTCLQWGGIEGSIGGAMPGARLRAKNNWCNTNGFTQQSGNLGGGGGSVAGARGIGIEIDSQFEDMRIENNDLYDLRGSQPVLIHTEGVWSEGFLFQNNLAFFNAPQGSGIGFTFEGTNLTLSPPLTGTGSTLFNSWFTQDPLTGVPGAGGTMSNNLAVAYYGSFSPPNNPTGLFSASSICTAFGGSTLSGTGIGNCTGGTPLFQTVLNQSTAALNLSQINFNNPPVDFRLNFKAGISGSVPNPFVSGGHFTTDGSDLGVNWNDMYKAQGAVNPPSVLSIGTTAATISWWVYDGSVGCSVDYAVAPNDPSTQSTGTCGASVAGGRCTASTGNSQSVNLTGLSALTQYNVRVLCPVQQPTTNFFTN